MAGAIGFFIALRPERVEIVHFVLPADYRGFFWVVVDHQSGQEIEPVGKQVTLRVPADGVLEVKDARFFSDWHKETVERPSTGTEPDHSHTALWNLGRSSDDVSTFLMGTKAERDAYYAVGGTLAAQDELQKKLAP